MAINKIATSLKNWVKREPVPFIVIIIMTICIIALVIWSLFHQPEAPPDKHCKPQQGYISDLTIGTSNKKPSNFNACPSGYTPVDVKGATGSNNNINFGTKAEGPFSQLCYKKADAVCDDTILIGDIKAVKLKGDFPKNPKDICSKKAVGEDGYFPVPNYFPDQDVDDIKPYWGQFVHNDKDCDKVAICAKSGTRKAVEPIQNININVSNAPDNPCPQGKVGGQPIVSGSCLKDPQQRWNFCYVPSGV